MFLALLRGSRPTLVKNKVHIQGSIEELEKGQKAGKFGATPILGHVMAITSNNIII